MEILLPGATAGELIRPRLFYKHVPNWLRIDDRFAYLATPYSRFPGGIETAHDAACRLTARLMDAGWPIFCPIAHTHTVSKHTRHDPTDAPFWIAMNRGPLMAAHTLVVAHLPSWEDSAGVAAEVAAFEANGRHVLDLDPETLRWSLR